LVREKMDARNNNNNNNQLNDLRQAYVKGKSKHILTVLVSLQQTKTADQE
jgi:hypothetical protein